jgi:hypothetical protein
MAHDNFDRLENQATAFARTLLRQGECADCVARALVFAAIGLAFESEDGVAAMHQTLAALVRGIEEQEALVADGTPLQ